MGRTWRHDSDMFNSNKEARKAKKRVKQAQKILDRKRRRSNNNRNDEDTNGFNFKAYS